VHFWHLLSIFGHSRRRFRPSKNWPASNSSSRPTFVLEAVTKAYPYLVCSYPKRPKHSNVSLSIISRLLIRSIPPSAAMTVSLCFPVSSPHQGCDALYVSSFASCLSNSVPDVNFRWTAAALFLFFRFGLLCALRFQGHSPLFYRLDKDVCVSEKNTNFCHEKSLLRWLAGHKTFPR
jgi:hypothetical protein